MNAIPILATLALGVVTLRPAAAVSQQAGSSQAQPAARVATPALPPGVAAPPDYVIGPEDVLSVVFWREQNMSADAVVRPDGKISLPLLNDVQAAGLTPEQLRQALAREASRFVQEPTVAVVVKQINSRKVYITGEVARPGAYPLVGPMTVLQLIALAGGLSEYANGKDITIMRLDATRGSPLPLRFNYNDVVKRRNLWQNVELRPGDTVIVP